MQVCCRFLKVVFSRLLEGFQEDWFFKLFEHVEQKLGWLSRVAAEVDDSHFGVEQVVCTIPTLPMFETTCPKVLVEAPLFRDQEGCQKACIELRRPVWHSSNKQVLSPKDF